LVPQARGRGAATRALRLITDWTIATTEVIRLDLFTDIENDASGRVAERAGFEHEGVRRAWDLDREGRPVDVIFYVLVRDLAGRRLERAGPQPGEPIGDRRHVESRGSASAAHTQAAPPCAL